MYHFVRMPWRKGCALDCRLEHIGGIQRRVDTITAARPRVRPHTTAVALGAERREPQASAHDIPPTEGSPGEKYLRF